MKSNLAHEATVPQGELVSFPKNERQVMSKKEEGYTRMPNLLIDDQIMAQLSDKAFKCLMLIVRHTVGFDRASHPIATTQFQKYCGIKKDETVTKMIRELEQFKLVTVERESGCLNIYTPTLNQYHQTVVPPSNGSTHIKGGETTPTKQGYTPPIKGGSIKETLKENIKEIYKQEATHENSVDAVLNLWTPDLHSLNSWLQRSGEMAMTQEAVNQVLLEINAHYEPRLKMGLINSTQMYANFVKWMKRKPTQKPKAQTKSLNVNDAWDSIPEFTGEVEAIEIPEGFL